VEVVPQLVDLLFVFLDLVDQLAMGELRVVIVCPMLQGLALAGPGVFLCYADFDFFGSGGRPWFGLARN
jgi:hypothetical protein